MMKPKIYNPDPAWPEVVAVGVFLLLCLMSKLDSQPFSAYMAENWWPMLRLTLWVWGIARVIDLFTGGVAKRREMRRAYNYITAQLNAHR